MLIISGYILYCLVYNDVFGPNIKLEIYNFVWNCEWYKVNFRTYDKATSLKYTLCTLSENENSIKSEK